MWITLESLIFTGFAVCVAASKNAPKYLKYRSTLLYILFGQNFKAINLWLLNQEKGQIDTNLIVASKLLSIGFGCWIMHENLSFKMERAI